MAETGDGARRIKVVDRRWFDEKGDLRRELTEPSPAPQAPEEEKREESPAVERAGEGSVSTPQGAAPEQASGVGDAVPAGGGVAWPSAVSFLQMVDFLAQQALLLLSGAQGVPASPEQARIFIDFLGILEDRTRGNLTPEEARALSDVLFQLRTLYVQTTGG